MSDLSTRDSILSKAEQVYKTAPNLVARLDSNEGPIVIKWFGWRHPIHYLFSPTFASRADASWTMAHALMGARARTPEPLYVFSRRQGGFIRENFFITRAVYPHTRLRPLLLSDAPEALFNTAIKDLARSIARMHEKAILHRDLTTANFLVNEAGEVFIVDLNRGRQMKKLTLYQRLTDLAKLTFRAADTGVTDRLSHIFFQVYEDEYKTGLDLVSLYRDYRRKFLGRRRLKRRLRRLTGGK